MQPNYSRKAQICDVPSLAAVACAFLLAPLQSVASPHPARNRFFQKLEQLFRGIRGSPEVGDVDFSEFPVGVSSFERALFSLASSNWF